jgi:hypothetical protein
MRQREDEVHFEQSSGIGLSAMNEADSYRRSYSGFFFEEFVNDDTVIRS